MITEALRCYQCRRPVSESALRSGLAFEVGSLTACDRCVEPLLARLTPEQRRAVLRKAASLAKSPSSPPSPPRLRPAPLRTTGTSVRSRPLPSPRRSAMSVILAVSTILILIAIAFFATSKPGSTSRTTTPRLSSKPSPRSASTTPPATVRTRIPDQDRHALIAAISALETDVRASAGRETYQQALDTLTSARTTRNDVEWIQAVSRLEREIRDAADGQYLRLKPKALDAMKRGSTKDLEACRNTLKTWGIPRYIDDLNKALDDRDARLRAGLVGWWRLDETGGSRASDDSGCHHHGSLNGGATWTEGRVGGALILDGKDDHLLASSPAVTSELTIAAWIRPARLDGDRAIAGEDGRYAFKTRGNALRFTTPGIRDHDCRASLIPDVWQHVVVTFRPGSPGGASFYKNGSPLGSQNASALRAGPGRFQIGRNQWGASQLYRGSVDDLRVYNRILSPGEIRRLAEGRPIPPTP